MERRLFRILNASVVCVLVLFFLLKILSNHNNPELTPQIRNLAWKDINFIHTTDTHGWYSGHINQKQYNANWGDFISFTSHIKGIANENNQDILLIDTGDRHDGNGLTDVTIPNGVKALPIFMKEDYDLITIGNHELYLWENSKQEYETIVHHYGSNYVCSNVEYKLDNGTFVPFSQKYKYFKTPNKNIRVLSFGFLFDFTRNNEHSKVISIEETLSESWFSDVLNKYSKSSVDLIVIIGHIPVTHSWTELYHLHTYLREKYPETLIQYFGGHSHIRDFSVFDEKSTGLQSGRFCETLGWASVDTDSSLTSAEEIFSRSYIDFNLKSFMHHTNHTDLKTFRTKKGSDVKSSIDKIRKELRLDEAIGYVHSNYYMDYVPLSSPHSIFHLLTEKVLPSLVSENANSTAFDQKIVIINTGSVRYDLYKGPYTIDTQYIVSPFKNKWVKLAIPKHIATLISDKLNDNDYILAKSTSKNTPIIDNRRLLPEHQFAMLEKSENFSHKRQVVLKQQELDTIDSYFQNQKLTKGYVTFDDFGHTGDDTPHRPVVNFPITNVVESRILDDSMDADSLVDVIFYDFISPNILWALDELNFTEIGEIEFYSNTYLSQLLGNYIGSL